MLDWIEGKTTKTLGCRVAVQLCHPAMSNFMNSNGKQQGQDSYRKKLGQA